MLQKIAASLLGAAFGLKVLDGSKPLWARVAYGAVSVDLITSAFENKPLFGLGKGPLSPNVQLNFQEKRVRSLQDRVAHVHQQMIQGTRDPKIYALAREVVSRKCGDRFCIDPKDHRGEAVALFMEVKKRVRYVWDPTDYDAFATPNKTLQLASGDCDDMDSLLGALLRTIGIKVRSRVVQTQGESTWNHIYLMADIDGQWMPLDLTVNQPPGWEVPANLVIRKQDFDVVDGDGGPQLTR